MLIIKLIILSIASKLNRLKHYSIFNFVSFCKEAQVDLKYSQLVLNDLLLKRVITKKTIKSIIHKFKTNSLLHKMQLVKK
jgi:hypothetical protein